MDLKELDAVVGSGEFKELDRKGQQETLRGYFKLNIANTKEYAELDATGRNETYRGYLNTYLPKSMIEKVVEKVDTFAKDPIGNIIGKRDNSQNFPAKKPQPQPQQTTQATTEEPKPKGTTPWDNLMEAKKIDTRFVTSDPAKVKAAAYADKKKKEDAHNKLNQQLGDAPLEDRTLDVAFVGGGAVHGIKGAAEMVAGKVLKNKEMVEQGAKASTAGGAFAVGDAAGQVGAVAAMEGVDAAMDEEWKKENPTLAAGLQMGAGLIVGGVAGYKAEMRALTTGQQQIFDAADDIIKSSSESMGIENPKNVNRDEAIAKALNEEYGVSANPATEVGQGNAPKTPSTQTSDGKDLQGESVLQNADEVKASDEITPVVDNEADTLKAKMKAEQDERLRVANEEMLARKAEYEAQTKAKEEADAAYASDVEFIENHPRISELIDSRRNITAKQAEKPNIRESDRQIIHENNGDGYETSVIPAYDVKNYAHDFAITKSDIAQYEKNGMSPELAEKFKKDLDVLDNNPVYARGEDTNLPEGVTADGSALSHSTPNFAVDERLLQSAGEVKPRSDEPLDDFGNPIFAKGGDNILVGAWAGIDEDENGNITFDPAKFIMGLGGYTALKAFVKNPTVQREAKEYVIRALNELDKKSYARYLTGEMNIVENAPVKNADTAKGGFYSAAERAIEKMPNKMDATAFVKYLKNNGVKDDEITWSGIAKAIEGKETITKAEIKEAFGNPEMGKVLKQNRLTEEQVKELNALSDEEWDALDSYDRETYFNRAGKYDSDTNPTKYDQYALKGIGENYREELVTIKPELKKGFSVQEIDDNGVAKYYVEEQGESLNKYPRVYNTKEEAQSALEKHATQGMKYKSSHWDEPNVLLHTRKQDTLIDGERTLLVEEIQSDWHQAGRKQGYKDNKQSAEFEIAKEATAKLYEKYGVPFNGHVTDRNYNQLVDAGLMMDEEAIINRFDNMVLKGKNNPEGIPQAPYAKTWQEFGMRQVIDEAVMSGYERVAWVTGKTSADRYSLSKSVDRLVYNKDANIIQGFKDGEEVMYKTATENDLESLIGKDPAKKLMDSEVKPNIYEIKGEALDIGGDGMRGFYDKILVDFTRKYTKKWGVEVETKKLVDGTEVHSFPVNAKMKEDVSKNGQALYAQGGGVLAGVGEDENGNMTFDPMMALAGIAGTSVIMSKTVRNNLSKLIGKTEHLSDSAIQGMVRVAIKSADKATASKLSTLADNIMDSQTMDDVIGHKIYEKKDYMKLRESTLRAVNGSMEYAARLHLQLAELSSGARETMYLYMTGDKSVAITPELKAVADTFVQKIDDLGREMVDNGHLTQEAYDEWKGQYLHRRYTTKIKGENDWKSGKGEFTIDKIKMRGKTWDATADEYEELLKNGEIGKVSEGKIEVIKSGEDSYKLRRDWTAEERASMGEIRDVAYSLPETIGRMAQMIEYGKMLKGINPNYIFDVKEAAKLSDKSLKQSGYVKLDGSKYGALNGRWVNRSIAEDIKGVHNDTFGRELSPAGEAWQSYVRAVKMSHTIYNPTAHVNNTLSNITLQTGAGLNPLKAINYAKDGAIANTRHSTWKTLDAKRVSGLSTDESAELARIEADEDFKLWRELEDRGMFGRSNLNEMLSDYMSPSVKQEPATAIGRAAKKALIENPQRLYQAEDDIMRFAAAKQLIKDGLWDTMERNGKRVFDKRMMSIDEAMDYVNTSIVPDYTKPMSKAARWLRDTGIMPFMSWTYHSTPVLLNQLKNHPTRFLAIIGAWTVTDLAFDINPIWGEDMPEKMAASSIVIDRDANKVTTARVSSMIPHAQIMPWNISDTYIEPIMSFGVSGAIAGAYKNYNPYFEDEITHKKGIEKNYQLGKNWVMNIAPTPDVLDKLFNIGEAHVLSTNERRRNRVFEPRTGAQEAASLLFNVRTYDIGELKRDQESDLRSEERADKKFLKRVFE